MPRNTSATLGEYFDKFVADKFDEGRFQSVSEVVRTGLRKLEEDEAKLMALRRKLQTAEASPVIVSFDGEAYIEKLHKTTLNETEVCRWATRRKRPGRTLALFVSRMGYI